MCDVRKTTLRGPPTGCRRGDLPPQAHHDGYPLYAAEIYELLTVLAGEIRDVREALLADYCTHEQLEAAVGRLLWRPRSGG